ncbi:enoyl-CoA hydratase/isomerase family protein [Micromonospora inositola]|uniref:Enoyl-CoA hydratase/isomerase n=1 Tax=Micromonospora inositola TaxID=47865 RepID=A0A1C5K366_9ACTN|nr:enoyl-CoA hydratase-related protein [Micromonospora inositola]SCG77225.1 Enoyl-CoA hydratase/isomerase [Micromonospora inositola]
MAVVPCLRVMPCGDVTQGHGRGRSSGSSRSLSGAVPGGGSTAHLPRLLGRGRALEALLGGDDFPAELAERYGWVNRALPDTELDTFVDTFARRIVNYDKEVIVARPGAGRSRLATLFENGLQQVAVLMIVRRRSRCQDLVRMTSCWVARVIAT